MIKEERQTGAANEQQQPAHSNRNLDDLFKEDATKATEPTPEEEATAEQQRKEALTERD